MIEKLFKKITYPDFNTICKTSVYILVVMAIVSICIFAVDSGIIALFPEA